MKRLFLLLIILSIFGCEKQDNPVPRDNEPAGEEIKTVQLGENLVMQVGDKVRIKDTLYYQSAKTDSIVPVYLNYVLSLDSIVDMRCYPPAFCDVTNVKGCFSLNLATKNELFDLILDALESACRRSSECPSAFDSVCVQCSAPHFNLKAVGQYYDHSTHYVELLNNTGFCVALDSVYPTDIGELPNWQPGTSPEQYYSQYKFYLRLIP